MSKSSADTPLMQQHRAIKQKYPDAILLFRVGDFYETFGEDAIVASKVLGITLTKRNNGAAASSELAGFPHHALDTYLHKLVKAGYRVAICDQLEDPKTVKGIVKRGVTEMVTPGVATNDKLLEHNSNNFLAAIHFTDKGTGIAFLDISTGEFFIAEGNDEYIDKLLQGLKPAEVIYQRSYQKHFKETFGARFYTYTMESWIFDEAFATESLLKHFQTHSLKGFGIESLHNGITAAGAILYYLKETEHPNLQHITSIQRMEREDFLWMDRFTIRNLELLHTGTDTGNSLLKVLDNTVSPMGARMLRRWMIFPLKDIGRINERLDAVAFLVLQPDLRKQLAQAINTCGDIERLVSKIPMKKINPREVMQLAKGLEQTALIKQTCAVADNPYLQRLADALDSCETILHKIRKEINDNPPVAVNKGEVIKAGVHEELDQLRNIASGGKEFLVNIQQREAEKTGISSLKISFNNVFGYYLEVTNIHKNKVPADWIRKQTLANAERYITPELKEYEEKITGAEDKILAIELDLYDKLLLALQDYIAPIQVNGNMLATLDCLVCFAEDALQYNYKKPELHEGVELAFTESRHPVIERNLPAGEQYISNDILLNQNDQQIIILTGPNMSGKSAILRQTALITLMAHMGSFVPASSARVPLTDKIFTRVGASDNLSGGESTFMVEMNETASIINNISQRSLILLDEIGRGTSTYDGISIAWSIVEYLHNSPAAPKTLFATHYHELNELEEKLHRVQNYHVTNKEVGNKIIFLRKLARGGSTHSFGIHVAKMAGMPPALIDRANEILAQLEERSGRDTHQETAGDIPASMRVPSAQSLKNLSAPQMQLSIFDAHSETFDEIRKKLNDLDINRLTPVEALMKLNEIKSLLK
ncbi:MAG: DNA mismatch repair protein MutS [Chitinophagaceae bacterium]|nr:DNA mismatch repair protein MutS [Chitinophagaceae bacterium]MCA6454413.1 DNA mismatch repair protein MutS [Chitinophagaceae bacterium]MCA6459305.1 DNA mismatch repair protein MutS [Chitinophagaceae bacterium]MCA6464891.1 DNA mismatch repair protein MutS [Chitinophagaceae bacterium]